ncbi:MAG: hypothetical protein WCC57_18560 [Paracoccaceae bacterium]
MPGWYKFLLVLSILMVCLTFAAEIVIVSTMYTLGLATPFWLVAANLWWIMLLAGPVVWFARNRKVLVGIAISLGTLIVFLVGFGQLTKSAVAALSPPKIDMRAGILAATTPPTSVEFFASRREDFEEQACGPICEGLLTGGQIKWVRVVPRTDQIPETKPIVFYRADATACQAFDPEFAAAPCLLAREDIGDPADLRITKVAVGDGSASRESVTGLVTPLWSRQTIVQDQRGATPKVLFDQTEYQWFEAMSPIPLFTNVGFDGNGVHGGGPTFTRERKKTPPVDLVAALQSGGLAMGSAREWNETKPAVGKHIAAEGYFSARPYDAPLLASMLDISQGAAFASPQGRQLADWLKHVERTDEISAAEKALLRRVADQGDVANFVLQNLMSVKPELFFNDFTEVYGRIQTGTDAQSQQAAQLLRETLRHDPVGSHDSEAALFLQALKSRKQEGYLSQIVGLYGFDPTPFLQERVAEDPEFLWMAVDAACKSDPKWAPTLAPFVHAQMMPLLSDLQREDDILRAGTTALLMLGREDLARDLRGRVDWQAAMEKAKGQFTPEMTLERLQDYLMGSLTMPDRC